jgi:hypothetical protein
MVSARLIGWIGLCQRQDKEVCSHQRGTLHREAASSPQPGQIIYDNRHDTYRAFFSLHLSFMCFTGDSLRDGMCTLKEFFLTKFILCPVLTSNYT